MSIQIYVHLSMTQWQAHMNVLHTSMTYQNHYIDGIVLETRHANKLGQTAIYASPPRQAAPHLIYYYLYLRVP